MKRILKYFGYIHQSELTPEFLFTETGKLLGNPRDIPEVSDMEVQFFKDLAAVDNIDEFLYATMLADMKRGFACTDEERKITQGGYARAAYFRSGIAKARQK